jgi:glycosyltransferase involved in cell wall biosynthesis
MANPQVSIIVPVFKTPIVLLRRSLHSVLDQTLADIELVAVDDASPDDCPQVLDEIAAADERLTVIHRAENGRAGAARNEGLEIAQGEFVLFADADDCLMSDACSRLVALARDNEADVVACSWTDVDGAGQTLRPHALADRLYDLSGKADRLHCFHSMTYALWNKLFRREMLGDLRFVSFEANIGEDTLFNVGALCRCRRMVTTSYSGYRYTVHWASATGRSAKGLPYLETISRSQQAIAETLAATDVAHDREYADWLALKRFVTGCEWIAENRDVAERTELWEHWRNHLSREVLPGLETHRTMGRLFRTVLKMAKPRVAARMMRVATRAHDRATGTVRSGAELLRSCYRLFGRDRIA